MQSNDLSAARWPAADPFFSQLRTVLSPERLMPYTRSHDGPLASIARYWWNLRLSESCYPLLSAVEVALRNRLYNAIAKAYPTGPWGALPCWLDRYPSLLAVPEQQRVTQAMRTLQHRGHSILPGRIVAELTFGFWTSLFDVRYEHGQRFWPTLLGEVFPYLPRRMRTRRIVSARLQRIRYLRNRVFHHEPIWHWRDLRDQYEQMEEVLAWLSPDLIHLVGTSDRFSSIYGEGWKRYQSGVLG